MSVRNLANLDRTVFQPLGRIIQEAFADGFIGTGSITITRAYTGSGASNRGLYLTGSLDGGGGSAYGMFKFRTYVDSVLTSNAHTLCAQLHIKDAGRLVDTPEYASAPLYVTVETEIASANPDLSGGSLAAMYIGYYVEEGGGAPVDAFPFTFNTDQAKGQWDGLIKTQNMNDIGAYVSTSNAPALATGDVMIPVKLGGILYYLVAFADTGL